MPRFEIETPQGRFEVEAPDEQSALEAIQQMDAEPQSSGFMRSVDDFGRGIADMTSFGFADEVSAGLGAATGVHACAAMRCVRKCQKRSCNWFQVQS